MGFLFPNEHCENCQHVRTKCRQPHLELNTKIVIPPLSRRGGFSGCLVHRELGRKIDTLALVINEAKDGQKAVDANESNIISLSAYKRNINNFIFEGVEVQHAHRNGEMGGMIGSGLAHAAHQMPLVAGEVNGQLYFDVLRACLTQLLENFPRARSTFTACCCLSALKLDSQLAEIVELLLYSHCVFPFSFIFIF